jgi:hypothetical protein
MAEKKEGAGTTDLPPFSVPGSMLDLMVLRG